MTTKKEASVTPANSKCNTDHPNATLHDRIRAWSHNLGLTSPRDQFLVTIEEIGELHDAINRGDRDATVDALGDVEVTLTILYDILTGKAIELTHEDTTDDLWTVAGRIAEGLRKSKKTPQAAEACAQLHNFLQTKLAKQTGISLDEALQVVVPIIESRAADIKVIDGTAIKAADQATTRPTTPIGTIKKAVNEKQVKRVNAKRVAIGLMGLLVYAAFIWLCFAIVANHWTNLYLGIVAAALFALGCGLGYWKAIRTLVRCESTQ